MLKLRMDRDICETAILYHLTENRGLTPVLETDADLIEWTVWSIRDLAGMLDDSEALLVAIDGDGVVIGGDTLVIDAVRQYML